MGDCRVKIVIANSLADAVDDKSNQPSSTTAPSTATVSFAKVYSSDTTIREVLEENSLLWKILSNDKSNIACRLWDVTVYPPIDITSWPLHDFPDLQGPKSKTLHSAGWFPSGTILVIPSDMEPNQFSDKDGYEDTQYNQHEQLAPAHDQQQPVEFEDPTLRSSGSAKPLPSQVMASVTNRFENDDEMNDDDEETRRAKALRHQQYQREQAQRLQERTAKLDARIARLEEQADKKGKKNKKVSDQVLRMLVKSRATGDKNLKMMDRIYFQCVVLQDDTNGGDGTMTKEHRYFSPQDTFAKIGSTFANKNSDLLCEVLCRQKTPSGSVNGDDKQQQEPDSLVYRRFPVTMRIYEAMANGYLTDNTSQGNKVDTLVVRWYRDREDATPSILDDKEEENGDQTNNDMDLVTETATTATTATNQEAAADNDNSSNGNMSINCGDKTDFQDTALREALESTDSVDDKGKKRAKKASAAAVKVKQMKIKSKAKGDTKRIPKVEQRTFLEVVTVSDTGTATTGYYFLAKTDPIERILQYCSEKKNGGATSSPNEWEFLVPTEKEGYFRRLSTTSMTTQQAEEQNVLPSFGRLILRRRKS